MKRLNKIFIIMFYFLLLTVEQVYSQPGRLDETFGQDGIVTTALNVNGNGASSYSTIQSDGKIILAGSSSFNGDNDFALIRYNKDGSLDNTFGTNGVVITNLGSDNDLLIAIALQDDGKIISVGHTDKNDTVEFALVRYNINGKLDDTFGSNGIVITPFGTSSDEGALSVAIQTNDKIIVGGYSGKLNSKFLLARYNPNGALDNSFGVNGFVTTKVGATSSSCFSIALQTDGKIVAGGSMIDGGDNAYFAVARYNQNGTLDNTFGSNGIITTSINTSAGETINKVLIQNDGKILAAGSFGNGMDYGSGIFRFNENGSSDNTFGNNGLVSDTVILTGRTCISLEDDGKIITLGMYANNNDFVMNRYNADGSLDSSFGESGRVTTSIGTSTNIASAVILQNDSKIITSGTTKKDNHNEFVMVRYNTDGELDGSFGNYGIVNTTMGRSSSHIMSLSIQKDDKIIAVGNSKNSSNDFDFAVARYNSKGELDNTFGANGTVTTPIGNGSEVAYSSAIQNHK